MYVKDESRSPSYSSHADYRQNIKNRLKQFIGSLILFNMLRLQNIHRTDITMKALEKKAILKSVDILFFLGLTLLYVHSLL